MNIIRKLVFTLLLLVVGLGLNAQGGGETCAAAVLNSVPLPWSFNDVQVCKVNDDFDKTEYGPRASCASYTIDKLGGLEVGEWVYHFSSPIDGVAELLIDDFQNAGAPGSISPNHRNGSFQIIQGCPGNMDARCMYGMAFDQDPINPFKTNFAIEAGVDYYLVVENRSLPTSRECIQFDLSVGFTPEQTIPDTPAPACANSDFSSGNLSNWRQQYGHSGIATPGDPAPLFSPIASGTDPNFTGQIYSGGNDPLVTSLPRVKPGSSFSYQLGNSATIFENFLGTRNTGEQLSQTFIVDAGNPIYSYSYALVQSGGRLEEDHAAGFFTVRFKDVNGNILPLGANCGNITRSAILDDYGRLEPDSEFNAFTATLGNLLIGVYHTNWITREVDLTPYIGQQITIEYTVGDSPYWNTRFSYAYVEANCNAAYPADVVSECLVSCMETVEAGPDVTINIGESIQLEALPMGGTPVSYSWSPITGLDDASVADPIANPTVTTTYTVTADFGGGCTATDQVTVTVVDNDSCRTELMNVIPNPSFETYNTCPDAQFQMDRVANWINPSFGSTDYLNTCGFVGENFQPTPSFPIPDGNGFIGMYIGGNTNPEYKEHAGVCLDNRLIAGASYELEFFVGFGTEALVAGAQSPSPNTFVLYGTTDCNNIPYNQNSFEPCPFGNNPNFVELGRVEVSGNEGSWVKATIAMVPSFDVEAIVLGGICAPIDSPTERYYFLDDFKLFQDTGTGNTLDAGPDVTINFGESTQLEALPTGGTPISYTWTPATGLDDATIADPVAGPAMTTTYTVTADFGGGCTATDQVTVTVIDPDCPLMLSGGSVAEATCGLNDGGITGIVVNGNSGMEDYRWTDTDGMSVGTALDLVDVGLGSYTLTVTEDDGCQRTLTFAVNESGPPDLDDAALVLTDTTCGGTTGSITGIAFIGEGAGAVFRWTDPEGNPVGNALDLAGVPAGTYTLQVTDALGCGAIAGPYTIGSPPDCEGELPEQGPVRIANTMTPNGDGANDMFYIEGIGAYPNSVLQVYNRWGNKVFEQRGYSNDWYGTYRGSDLPVATYYYVLSLGDEAQTLHKGYISILR